MSDHDFVIHDLSSSLRISFPSFEEALEFYEKVNPITHDFVLNNPRELYRELDEHRRNLTALRETFVHLNSRYHWSED